jgi:hypothetical protein
MKKQHITRRRNMLTTTTSGNRREILMEQLQRKLPYIRFLKVRTNSEGEAVTYFEQPDTPQFHPGETFVNPLSGTVYEMADIHLSMESYPRVLSSMTAMEAGAWALNKCLKEKWEVTVFNLKAALTNLEMEL